MALALTADRILTGETPEAAREGFLLVDGSTIAGLAAAPPPEAIVHSYPGASLMPGLIDCHTHVSVVPSLGNQLGQMRRPAAEKMPVARANVLADLMAGATTLRIMGEEHGLDFALRDEIESGLTAGPQLLCSGVQLAREGCHGQALTAVSNRAEIDALVDDNASRGASQIKAFATGGISSPGAAGDQPPFSEEELSTIVEAARRHDLPVAVHAVAGAGVSRAIAAGVSSIEHGVRLDEDQIACLRDRDVAVVGTFSILFHPLGIEGGDGDRADIMNKLKRARAEIGATWRRLLAAGVRIGLGTDSVHGSLAYEAARLVDFGASPPATLRALTTDAASICGVQSSRGTLEAGKQADVIAVAGDPRSDIRCLAAPLMVMSRGEILPRI